VHDAIERFLAGRPDPHRGAGTRRFATTARGTARSA
jgi:hypothetical protein